MKPCPYNHGEHEPYPDGGEKLWRCRLCCAVLRPFLSPGEKREIEEYGRALNRVVSVAGEKS